MSDDPERGDAAEDPKPGATSPQSGGSEPEKTGASAHGEGDAKSEKAAKKAARDPDAAGDSDAADEDAADEEDEGDEAEGEADADAPKILPAPKDLPTAPLPRPNYTFLLVSSVIFFLTDFLSKWWVVKNVEPKARVHTDGWWMRLNRVENPGGAWGIFGDQPDYIRLPFFFLISAVAVVFVVSLYRKLEPRQTALKWALPLLLGGAAGNLLDRIRHQSVVDFLEFTIVKGGKESFRWPTFNVADIWIVAGVLLMAIDMFYPKKPVPKEPVQADEEEEVASTRAAREESKDADVEAKDKPAKAEA